MRKEDTMKHDKGAPARSRGEETDRDVSSGRKGERESESKTVGVPRDVRRSAYGHHQRKRGRTGRETGSPVER